jgi:hypothetical protein
LAAWVGDEVEAVEVGVEGAQRVDLGAVAGAGGWATVALLEVLAPVLEVAIDLARVDVAGGALAEPVAVGGERFAVFAARAGGSGLPGQVAVERRQQPLVGVDGQLCGEGGRVQGVTSISGGVLVDASMQALLGANIQSQSRCKMGALAGLQSSLSASSGGPAWLPQVCQPGRGVPRANSSSLDRWG